MIYFTSDTHFNHDKTFVWADRGFSSVKEMNNEIIKRWNSIVTNDDEVYHLGDVMLGGGAAHESGIALLKQLNGKIHIIQGNHDTQTRMELYQGCRNIVEVIPAKVIKINKQHYFLCHYPAITANYDDKPLKQHLICLYGHTHQTNRFYNDNPFVYNVGVDAHNCTPVSIEEIDRDIHNKVQLCYTQKVEHEKWEKEYYENGLRYFDRYPACGEEILDN